MVDINQKELRKELISIYESYINEKNDEVIKNIRIIYDKYYRPANDEIMDVDICEAIRSLYPIAWKEVAEISKTKEKSKEDIIKILKKLKLNNK